VKRLFPILLLTLAGFSAWGQAATNASDPGKQMRTLPKEKVLEAEARPSMQSLRIEDGKVWINGNLAQKSELPERLQNVSRDFTFQTAMYGVSEVEFNLLGGDFLLKNGKLIELPPPAQSSNAGLVQTNANTLTKQDYYTNLKNESPSLFMQINREAYLTEKYMSLLLDYQTAPPERQPGIEEEIRVVLGELFDISLANMEMELRELEEEVNFIRQSIDERRANRSRIIEAKLEEVTED
jgi:hypothetical protein